MIFGLKVLSQERWHDFILVYSPLLRFWIRRKSSGNQAEDEILHDCLRTIFTGLPQFERGSTCGTFWGWLRVIVQRRVADHFRQNSTERPVPQAYFDNFSTPH